jgi:hypothetical protein
MKYKWIICISCLLVLKSGAQPPDGAFRITSAQYGENKKATSGADLYRQQTIKIFKDGYWIAAFFGNPKKPFSGSGGGTFKASNGKYVETLTFYSWDSTAVGDTYQFDYQLQGDVYKQEGYMNSEKYKNYLIKEAFRKIQSDIPLKNPALEGAWILQSAVVDSTRKFKPQSFEQIKIYSYPRFAWAQYNPATKQFVGAGGGTYQYDGQKLTEHIEYTTYDMALGTDYEITVKSRGEGTMEQTGPNGWTQERWKKAK